MFLLILEDDLKLLFFFDQYLYKVSVLPVHGMCFVVLAQCLSMDFDMRTLGWVLDKQLMAFRGHFPWSQVLGLRLRYLRPGCFKLKIYTNTKQANITSPTC